MNTPYFLIWHTLENFPPDKDDMQSDLVLGWSKDYGYEIIFYSYLERKWYDEFGNETNARCWIHLPPYPKNI